MGLFCLHFTGSSLLLLVRIGTWFIALSERSFWLILRSEASGFGHWRIFTEKRWYEVGDPAGILTCLLAFFIMSLRWHFPKDRMPILKIKIYTFFHTCLSFEITISSWFRCLEKRLGGGFKYFFHPYLKKWSDLTNGLKPPIRRSCALILHDLTYLGGYALARQSWMQKPLALAIRMPWPMGQAWEQVCSSNVVI